MRVPSLSFRSPFVCRRAPAPSPSSWTCHRCLSHSPARRLPPTGSANVFSRQPPPRSRFRRRGAVVALAAAGLVGLGYGWSDAKHAVAAVERASRVATALTLCINDYRITLKQLDKDPADRDGLLSACHKRCAERTYKVLERNGSIFIKLGQHLAAMGYLLPLEWTTTFIPLQDRCPVSSLESIERMIQDDTGHPVLELFSSFDPVPIGAASLAQVHRATLRETGQEVAVKLQHPALAEWIPLDMALTRFAFTNIKWFFPQYPMTWLSDEMEASLPKELDFECEADNIRRVKAHFSTITDVPLVIPDVIWAKPRILVMEFLPGRRLDDLPFLDSHHISRESVSIALAKIFNEMIFGDNAPLHCDPHGGNLALRPVAAPSRTRHKHNFEIILYDHGLYRDIPASLRASYAKLWLSVLDADIPRMRRYARDVAGVTDDQFPLFASAITGRDYAALTRGVKTPRSEQEKEHISAAMGEGLLEQLIQLLSDVPSIILLILKTNDLTRSLEENLQTGRGPERGFLIMARYCSRAVLDEVWRNVQVTGGLWNVRNLARWVVAVLDHWRVEVKVAVLDRVLVFRTALGLGTGM